MSTTQIGVGKGGELGRRRFKERCFQVQHCTYKGSRHWLWFHCIALA